ncbi:MAG: hypothetical protein L0226_10565 [Acidobacteria bacterium]|nr:hypothetical protein [Acidobacteriota bacterium]MCI0664307.1 hypothetical protein [Acidobacteriota bacterium]
MEVINPQLKELERKHEELRSTVDHMRGELDEIKRTTIYTARQTIWQFIIFAVTIAVILVGGIKYQSNVLRNEMNIRFEAMEKTLRSEMNLRFEAIENRIEQSEKNLTERFEDLKQEVRASRR